ncbi:MAG: ABC transporter permease [Spirochaetales bacterium]|nr:ABC transporter permease [Spirochaetales bacterium]
MLKKYLGNKNFVIGASLVMFLLLLLIYSFINLPYDPNKMDTSNTFLRPSPSHIMGTDNFGRDIFSRILKGSQSAFLVGIAAVGISMIIGVFLGAVSGYFQGWLDKIISVIMDAEMAFPGVILALIFITVFKNGIFNIAMALAIMTIPRFFRITRSGFMQIKEMDYIAAAKARGASDFRLMFLHILPNITSSLIVTASLGFSTAVLSEAGLSYLGLGIQPPDASWGKMLFEAQSYLLIQPWYAVIPGTMITLMVLGFNLLGDGIRDVTNH